MPLLNPTKSQVAGQKKITKVLKPTLFYFSWRQGRPDRRSPPPRTAVSASGWVLPGMNLSETAMPLFPRLAGVLNAFP